MGAKPSVATRIKGIHYRAWNRVRYTAIRCKKYSVYGMSTVVDTDCMSKEKQRRETNVHSGRDCKLYSQWDDPASLIFLTRRMKDGLSSIT